MKDDREKIIHYLECEEVPVGSDTYVREFTPCGLGEGYSRSAEHWTPDPQHVNCKRCLWLLQNFPRYIFNVCSYCKGRGWVPLRKDGRFNGSEKCNHCQ